MSGGFMVFVEYFFNTTATLKLLVTRNFINYLLFDDFRYIYAKAKMIWVASKNSK